MGGSIRVGQGRVAPPAHGAGLRNRVRPGGPLLPALLLTLVSLLLAGQVCFAQHKLALTDILDAPTDLVAIANGKQVLIYVGNLEKSMCREGAVYFDSQADRIRRKGVRPAFVLIGDAPDVRAAVLSLDLDTAAYIDAGRTVFGTLLDQRALPAVVLVDAGGEVLRSLYGGGDSLEGNISALLGEDDDGSSRWWLIIIPIAALAILPFLID